MSDTTDPNAETIRDAAIVPPEHLDRLFAEGLEALKAELLDLPPEQADIASRTLKRSLVLQYLAIGATGDELAAIENERKALKATLLTLGEIKAAKIGNVIGHVVFAALDMAIDRTFFPRLGRA